MNKDRTSRIEKLIRDVEEVAADFDEGTRRSFNDLVGEVRQLVQILSDAAPRLQFLEDKMWPWKISVETEEAADILIGVQNEELKALEKEHEKARDVARALYVQTDRRRQLEVYFLGQQIRELENLLKDNSIVYDVEPMPDCELLLE